MIAYKKIHNFAAALAALVLLSQCAVRSITPGDCMEINMDFDLSAFDMRHGWAFLSPSKAQYVGVDSEESRVRGKVLFTQHCQKCHGETGVGDGPLAKKLNIKPANLQGISKDASNASLVVQINNGKGSNMPQWRDVLNQEQASDLTNYIRSLKKTK